MDIYNKNRKEKYSAWWNVRDQKSLNVYDRGAGLGPDGGGGGPCPLC